MRVDVKVWSEKLLEPKNTSPLHTVRWCQCPMRPITSETGIIQFSASVANQPNSNHGMQGCIANKARVITRRQTVRNSATA